MQKVIILSLLAFIGASGPSARAEIVTLPTDVMIELAAPRVQNAIEWKVGDQMEYQVSVGAFGKLGTMVKSVTKDEGTAIWVRQSVKLLVQNETVDTLINKADGKILKMIRNGQEMDIPSDTPEIISQEAEDVTVPAGTFQSIHVVAKTQQISKVDVWINPRDTVMDGTLKQVVPQQFGEVKIELAKFTRAP